MLHARNAQQEGKRQPTKRPLYTPKSALLNQFQSLRIRVGLIADSLDFWPPSVQTKRHMRWPLKIALAVGLVVLAGLITWQLMRVREPVYQGKPLTFWLSERIHGNMDEYGRAYALATSRDAVQAIGTRTYLIN